MNDNVLVKDDAYKGEYVAVADVKKNRVVGHGMAPQEALDMARSKGYEDPVLIYVPEKDSVHIY